MKLCGGIARGDVAGYEPEPCACLRPDAHVGPHLIQRPSGTYVAFELDWGCDCHDCKSDDRSQWCEVYGEVSKVEAQLLISTRDHP